MQWPCNLLLSGAATVPSSAAVCDPSMQLLQNLPEFAVCSTSYPSWYENIGIIHAAMHEWTLCENIVSHAVWQAIVT